MEKCEAGQDAATGYPQGTEAEKQRIQGVVHSKTAPLVEKQALACRVVFLCFMHPRV